eukprot:TRINITY_DN36481_c0_g1_i2.p1 TRINITY_DN36481_c0_g1~~TRINITY_DN36481_c0_g1_i2.p1  ORF type:complete len:132 (+),score=25.79 TRINITY_DN36481_c0_g1_i2:133-528(+)
MCIRDRIIAIPDAFAGDIVDSNEDDLVHDEDVGDDDDENDDAWPLYLAPSLHHPISNQSDDDSPTSLLGGLDSVLKPLVNVLVEVIEGLLPLTSTTLSLIHISEPTRLLSISYAVFCLKKKNKTKNKKKLK